MMSAPSLPTPQGGMPAGFATFLANIGQIPVDGGEGPSFDQLLAAAPAAAAPVAAAATTAIKIEQALPAPATTPTTEVLPVESDAPAQAPVAKTAPVETDAAAVLAANLLIALNGAVPGTTPAASKPVPTETGTDAEVAGAETGEAVATAPTTPSANLAAVVAAITPPPPAKPAKPVEAAPAPTDTNAAAPIAARPRDTATPLPILAGAEPQAARPAEAAPSITILFPQPTAHSSAPIIDAAAPVQLAERVLDMDSDGAWIDQLARDIAATKSESGDISFRLMPRHLGRLDVAMQMGDEGVALKMDTHHEATATIVTAAQGRLVDELRQQGVRVAGAEVTCTPGETGRQSQSQSQGRTTAPDPSHLIETATERAEPRDEDRAADRRGRFA